MCGCVRRARVKFWFIKNYMSPQMKRFLPRMAAHYGFDHEFVTYKWPSWLHKQVRNFWQHSMLHLWVCKMRFLGDQCNFYETLYAA